MNKQEIEKAIEYFRAGNFLGKSMDKHINVAISVLEQQLNNGWMPDIMKEVLGEETTDIILSNPDEFKKWLERGIWNCKRLNELSNCKNGWIPVSERLPEDFEFKRVYLTVRSIASEHCFVTRAKWSYGRFKHLNGAEISNIYEIVAWREEVVPEPYKEVKDAERN